MNFKQSILVLSICSLGWAGQLGANELAPKNHVAKTTFDKLLDVSPLDADEYVQLQNDISKLNKSLIMVKTQHGENLNQLSSHQQAADNEYNRDEKFMLFRQLDNQEYKNKIDDSGYSLNRVREKLHVASNRYQQLRLKVNDLYAKKYNVSNELLIDKLLDGEVVSLSITQQKLVINTLIELRQSPHKVVKLLEHPNVVEFIPDYLKEQLKVFDESDISLVNALSNEQVMGAVVDKLKAIDFLEEQQVTGLTGRVYSLDQTEELLGGESGPIYLHNNLSLGGVNPLTAVELYDIPIPSEELVNTINSLKNSTMRINHSALFKSLNRHNLNKLSTK